MLGEREKVRLLDAIQIDLQPVRLLIKEWVSERSLSRDSKTPIVAESHRLGRGWVGGTALPLWQTTVLLSVSVEPSTEI